MSTVLLVIGILFLCGATVLAFRPVVPAAVVAYVGLMFARWSGHVPVGTPALVFWGVAALLVLMISSMTPVTGGKPAAAVAYTSGGALVGTVVGLVISMTVMVAGSCVGAVIGTVAFSLTPAGRGSAGGIVARLAADGLPAVVTFCIVGVALSGLLAAATL